MAHSDHFLPLYDKNGTLYSVMLSADLWLRYHSRLEPIIRNILEDMEPTVRPEPLHEWDDFKAYWDFKYPYCADVRCDNCGKTTHDWLDDPDKPFLLRSAQLGGLAVFTCKNCGATIRKKHFKDHICFEFSKSGCGC